jgi:hypothetical protein
MHRVYGGERTKYCLSSLFKFGKKTVNMPSEAVRHEREI